MALTTDREKVAHLLRRFGLGASEAEVNFYGADGYTNAVDKLLADDQIDESAEIPIEAFAGKRGKVVDPVVPLWWIGKLCTTRKPLREKMTVFWHNHFATGLDKIKAASMMVDEINGLRSNALGNFRTILGDVSKSPAMLIYLDGATNRVNNLNENFGREVMELFTLGVGHYAETDVRESAKAYTGWSIKRGEVTPAMVHFDFINRPNLHDNSDKTIFGQTGNFDGDQVLDMLCAKPQMAEFIVHKLWSWFVYLNPEPALVTKFADIWRSNNLEMKPLLRAIMTSPEFVSPKADRTVYKDPVSFVITTFRQLGYGAQMEKMVHESQSIAPIRPLLIHAASSMKNLGMQLCYPPNVSGWHFGPAWISTGTMLERIHWGEALFGQTPPRIPFDPNGLFTHDPTPGGVVAKLCSIFDVKLDETQLQTATDATTKAVGNSVTDENANLAAASAARMIFATPQFQLC